MQETNATVVSQGLVTEGFWLRDLAHMSMAAGATAALFAVVEGLRWCYRRQSLTVAADDREGHNDSFVEEYMRMVGRAPADDRAGHNELFVDDYTRMVGRAPADDRAGHDEPFIED